MMRKIINARRYTFYLWVGAAWLFVWIFINFVKHPELFVPHALNEIWLAVFITAVNFLFFEYSLPLIRKRRTNTLLHILLSIFLVTIHLLIVSFGLYGWTYFGTQLHIYTSFRFTTLVGGFYAELMEAVFYQAETGIAATFFFLFAKLFYDNFKLKQTTQRLRFEKKEAELNFLKAQTNPHFLFNTLNNIYTLAGDNSALAQESILRLSKILRFMLYETNREFITVAQEVEIIRDYISLEKLRYDDSMQISFNHKIEDMEQRLPPLLLMPLVENSFKHGSAETVDEPFVSIHLSTTQQQLLFVVKNSMGSFPDENDIRENIGLSNLRRQLQLLYSSHDLSVGQHESQFTATLKINLGSHV